MDFIVKRITVDPGVSLTPLPNSRYELIDIKRAWIDCEIKDGNSSYEVGLILDGIERGRLLTITAKGCPIDTSNIMNQFNSEFARIFMGICLLPYKFSREVTICTLQVNEKDFLGALHKAKELGGFSLREDIN